MRPGSRWLWISSLVLSAAAAAQTPGSAPSIQYAEPLSLALNADNAQFEAYGRHFALTLSDNGRVLAKLSAARKAEIARIRLVRGSVDGAPGSWVRLTESAAGLEGAIWDGHELYAVTTYSHIVDKLTTPLDLAPTQAVIYRLSDVRDALPASFCALGTDETSVSPDATGLDQFREITQELGVITPPLSRQVEISLIGDAALQAAEADPTAAMLARLNIVEGIYGAQLGVLVLATDVRLMPVDADPLTSTAGNKLLEQLGQYRKSTPEVRARGVAHLVTGKDLDGTTAGIAYVGTVCQTEHAVSVSEHAYGTTISALIMAHELGHNFGATHDGVAGTRCAATGGGFIMAPAVSGYATFSQCSIETMQEQLAAASCVTEAEYADASLESSETAVAGEAGLSFTLPFRVRSVGNRAAENVTATITLPAITGFGIDSAASSAGACSVNGLTATCALGAMNPGEVHSVSFTARALTKSSFNVQARVAATNDRVASNDTRAIAVALRSGVDAAVTLSASAAELPAGAPLEWYVDIASLRALAVRDAVLSFNSNQPITAASLSGATCRTTAYAVSCQIAELPAGATRRLVVQSGAVAGGPIVAAASTSVSGDGDFSNNTASFTGWARPEHDIDLSVAASTVDLGVGAPYEYAYTLRSRGTGATDDVVLLMSTLSSAIVVDAVDAPGGACAPAQNATLRCEFAPLAPGETRVVRVRVHGTRVTNADVIASASTANDGYLGNNAANVFLRIDNTVDLAVTLAAGGTGVEDSIIEGEVTLRSNGRETARDATLDIVLHAAGTLRSAGVHGGEACTLLTPQRARCSVPALARGAQVFVDYAAEFAEPGAYDVTFATATPGDTAPDNDSLTRVLLVRPYNDIGVAGSLALADLVVGQTREQTFAVTTDRRALATARFVAPHYLPGLAVDAIRATAGDCRVDPIEGGVCDFTDLPANGSVTVTVTYRAASAPYGAQIAASVTTAGDVSTLNDAVRGRVATHGMTDLELRVGANVSGVANTTVTLPQIVVANGAETAVGTRLEVTLPAEVSLVGISASNALCSGTTVLRCEFAELDALSTSTVHLTVRAGTRGHFVAALKLTALNDANASNDAREVAIEVASGSTSSVASNGAGRSGGGSIEWLTALVLALCGAGRGFAGVVAPRRGNNPDKPRPGTTSI